MFCPREVTFVALVGVITNKQFSGNNTHFVRVGFPVRDPAQNERLKKSPFLSEDLFPYWMSLSMPAKINSAVAKSQDFEREKLSKKNEFAQHVSENNLRLSMKNICEKSTTLKEMEDKGEIKIVGAFYRLTYSNIAFIK